MFTLRSAFALLTLGPLPGYSQPEAPAVEVTATIPTGTRNYAPGKWGAVEVAVTNRSETAAEVLSALSFQNDANQQFGREMWVPPRSRRVSWHPVFVPLGTPAGSKSLAIQSLVYDRTGPEERVVKTRGGQMLSDGLLPVDTEAPITGWIGPAAWLPDRPAPTVSDMISAARVRAELPPKTAAFRGIALPNEAETWQGVEHLVLSGDRPLSDAAGLAAIRNWVYGGGRLWIVLNDVPPELVERLLGDDCGIHFVDRVGLTRVKIDAAAPGETGSDGDGRDYERPVEFVRVIAEGVEVAHSVDGWPASFWQALGQGEVLFTTLAPEAWVRPQRPDDFRRHGEIGGPAWVAEEPLGSLASRFFRAPEPSLDVAEIWRPFLTERIGYRVTSRRTVFAILMVSCGFLVAAAIWTGRKRRLERLLWIAPVISAATAAVLAAVGFAATESLESSTAEGQLVRLTPGATEVVVDGLTGIYSRETAFANVSSRAGGLLLPDMSGFGGEVRRMVWTDWDRWHWENLKLPSGIRFAPLRKHLRLADPAAATGAFGPEGFEGEISWPLQALEDAMIATPSGERVPARVDERRRFRVRDGERLASGAFVSGTILTDVQRGRQEVYRRLLSAGGGRRDAKRPTLFAWTRPMDLGFVYPAGSRGRGEALVAFPVEFERSTPGTRVEVPSAFVRLDPAPGEGGGPPSMLFEPRTGAPVEYASDIEAWARFRMPAEVVPLEIDEARIEIEVSGAVHRLELLRRSEGAAQPLQAWDDPAGTLRFTARGGDLPAVDTEGGILLGIRVRTAPADRSTKELLSYWRVTSFRVGATGRTRGEGRE